MAVSIVIEGPEGAGKSTQVALVERLLRDTTDYPVLRVREPGGTSAGDEIRRILLDSTKFCGMHPDTHMLLFSAARNELLRNVIYPFQQEHGDGIVLGDRCWVSTMTMQTVDGSSAEYAQSVQKPFMDYPNKLLYLDVPPEESLVRIATNKRLKREMHWRDEQGIEVYRAIRENYLDLVSGMKRVGRAEVLDGFVPPWELAYQIRNIALKEMAKDEELREGALVELKRFSLENMRDYARRVEMEGKVDTTRAIDEVENTRRIMKAPSADVLRHQMHGEWQSLGLIEGNRCTVERI